MRYPTYIFRSLRHFWKLHFSLFLGAMISATVLTGALLIGDSIRFSLNRMVDQRLGNTRMVVVGGSRFLSYNLRNEMDSILKMPVAALLMDRGTVTHPGKNIRINQVAILGIDPTFLTFSPTSMPLPAPGEVILGEELALRLGIRVGEELILKPEPISLVPVNAPMARETGPGKSLRLKVAGIARANQLGNFNLSNNQVTALNVFVDRSFLSKQLGLTDQVNLFLLGNSPGTIRPDSLDRLLGKIWQSQDMGFKIIPRPEKEGFDLLSDRIFMDSVLLKLVEKEHIPCLKIRSYLVNDISLRQHHTPYSFAAATDWTDSLFHLQDKDVIINTWTADDLHTKRGDTLVLKYYKIGPFRELMEDSSSFRISDILPDKNLWADSTLMPRFPGLSGTGNCRDWDAGVPIHMNRIRDKDEDYWDRYKGTPKVILSAHAAASIWKNPFGSITALRFKNRDMAAGELLHILTRKILPSDLGIQILDVREEGKKAAAQAVDFSGLFMGMSFFTILAAILLTMLLLSLNEQQRTSEGGVLAVLGLSPVRILWLRFTEHMMVLLLGSIAGAFLGILYNNLMLYNLRTLWNDMVRTRQIEAFISLPVLITGMVSGLFLMVLPVYFQLRRRMKQHLISQVKNNISLKHPRRLLLTGYILMMIALLLSFYTLMSTQLDQAALFMTASFLFLSGSLMYIWFLLSRDSSGSNPWGGVFGLAFRNLKMNPGRSLTIITLLSLGVFTILLTGAYRRTYHGEENHRQSGTGGFLLWGENSNGIAFNLNTPEGRNRLMVAQDEELKDVHFWQFMNLEGDDASCLNLNQAQHPAILAVYPQVFDSLHAFEFVSLEPGIQPDHPWLALEKEVRDHLYFAFADHQVIQYSLHKQLGDTLFYRNEAGERIGFVLAGALDNSIFQGRILISSAIFRKQFPSRGSSRVLLVDGPSSKKQALKQMLTASLQDYGMEITSTSSRLASFNSVENTYLTVFMMLSGLGLLLGTAGMGVLLLRNIRERRKELALMSALGISVKQIFRILFMEHLLMFVTGMATGILSALTGILPALLSPAFHLQGSYMLMMVLLILLSGILWIGIPTWIAVHKPLVPALKEEG